MENKNLKKSLGLGLSSLMAISNLNLAVFANVDQDDQAEENRSEEITDQFGEEFNELKEEHINEIENRSNEADKANDIKRKNFYQEKMKIEDRAALIRTIAQRNKMMKDYVTINEETFPDYNFREYVIKELNEVRLKNLVKKARYKAEKEGEDANAAEKNAKEMFKSGEGGTFAKIIEYGSEVRLSEMKEIKTIDVEWKNIKDLTGIEYFRNLKCLICKPSLLERLDLSVCNGIIAYSCTKDDITEIKGLDKLTNLYRLSLCRNENLQKIEGIDKLTNLTIFNCVNNTSLQEIKGLDKLTNLKYLDCSGCNLTTLDVSKLSKLESLSCHRNKNLQEIKGLNNVADLKWLNCSSCNLSEIDVSGLDNIEIISASYNRNLTKIIARNCPRLIDRNIERDEGCNIIRD